MEESDCCPLFKRGNHAAVSSYRPISVLNNFSKLFEFIIHDHVLQYVLNSNQCGFAKSKSTFIKLVTFLDFMTPVVRCQRQADSVYFDLSDGFDLAPHNMHKLSSIGFSDAYISWFRGNLTNRQS
jgi:hypothetical protein